MSSLDPIWGIHNKRVARVGDGAGDTIEDRNLVRAAVAGDEDRRRTDRRWRCSGF